MAYTTGRDDAAFTTRLLNWYAESARDLPWRRPNVSPWSVLVSEVMLQQTPVARVQPAWQAWLARWPTPAALAADSPGEAVRQWGRLGYPRRALRLHQSATRIVTHHDCNVPCSYDALRELPGLGDYTAAAVAGFAFDAPVAVLDTNVRRVHARVFDGAPRPLTASPTRPERDRATALLPDEHPGRFSVAVMELGALVCRARAPNCDACPVARDCRWLAEGRPGLGTAIGVRQTYLGTDRQARGRLLALLRSTPGSVPREALDATWPDAGQRDRALQSLITDGLVEQDDESYRLPG